MFCFFWLWGMWDPSSQTRDGTQTLKSEVLTTGLPGKSQQSMMLNCHYLVPWICNEYKLIHLFWEVCTYLWSLPRCIEGLLALKLEAFSSSNGMYNEVESGLGPSPGFYQLPIMYIWVKSLLWAWIFQFIELGGDSRWCGQCREALGKWIGAGEGYL